MNTLKKLSGYFREDIFRIAVLAAFLLWFLCFLPIYPEMIRDWLSDSNNSHGILVPIISLYFIWQKKSELKSVEISTSAWGVLILAMSVVIHILSYAGGIAFISRSMIIFSLSGLILFNFGMASFKLLALPIFFLFFMVPIPESIVSLVTVPLQLIATKLAFIIIHALTIPVYREGNLLYFAQTQLEVAEACSGIRSMICFIMLSVVFVSMIKGGYVKRFIILISAVPFAFSANLFRITCTGILAHFFGDKVAQGFLHEFSGIVVFIFGLVLFFLEYLLLSKLERKGAP